MKDDGVLLGVKLKVHSLLVNSLREPFDLKLCACVCQEHKKHPEKVVGKYLCTNTYSSKVCLGGLYAGVFMQNLF